MAKTATSLVDPRLAKALSHPMRAHVLHFEMPAEDGQRGR
jgi:hypothetical protein